MQKIKKLYLDKKRALSGVVGKYYEIDVISQYISWLKEHFKVLVGSDISAVVDSGNGVGGTVMPKLIEKMGFNNNTTYLALKSSSFNTSFKETYIGIKIKNNYGWIHIAPNNNVIKIKECAINLTDYNQIKPGQTK